MIGQPLQGPPGGIQKSAISAIELPAGASRADFFPGAVYFEQSNAIKEFKNPSHFRRRRLFGRLERSIYFLGPRRSNWSLRTSDWRPSYLRNFFVPEIVGNIFSSSSPRLFRGKFVAKFRVGG
jgi:hypothetical protein